MIFPDSGANHSITTALGAEDFRFVSEDIIILGSCDLFLYFENGDDVSPFGQLVAVDLNTNNYRTLELRDFPMYMTFRPRALEFSKRNESILCQ